MRDAKQIAFAFPRGARQESFIDGVVRYAREKQRDWTYLTPPESLALSVLHLDGWPGDGVLAAINTREEAEAALALGIPTVNVSSALTSIDVPTAIVDNPAIGRLAGEYLLSRGFRSFAFYGLKTVRYSADRYAGFAESIDSLGLSCACYHDEATFGLKDSSWTRQHDALAEWLPTLKRPCGLLAVSDYRARLALDACRHAGISVPDELAIVGVDNERVGCEHASPTLSSVARNDDLEGYRAAELLDRMMQGKADVGDATPTAPLGVVERESSSSYAVSDPRLRAALDYISEHLGDPITIDELTEQAEVSRRWLEYAFREELGQTPYQYLRRKRLSLAKRLLVDDGNAKVHEIARRTGFSSAKQLTNAFQQEFEMSPREWQRSVQGDGAG